MASGELYRMSYTEVLSHGHRSVEVLILCLLLPSPFLNVMQYVNIHGFFPVTADSLIVFIIRINILMIFYILYLIFLIGKAAYSHYKAYNCKKKKKYGKIQKNC